MNTTHLTTAQRVSAIAMGVVVLAAFLPWVSMFGISMIGVQGDGVITLLLAIAGLVILALTTGLFGAAKKPNKASQITLVVLAAITALIGLIDMNGAAAIGLYLTLLGGIGWVAGAVWQLTLTTQSKSSPFDGPPNQH